MDWSLVLVSQAIENTIDHSAGSPEWSLLVSAADYDKAIQAIHLYQLENRHWRWRRRLFKPGFLFDWASVPWSLLLCVFFGLSASHPTLRVSGEMDTAAVSHGQWWRLFTAMWLHADLGHLASNATLGFVLLGLVMGRYGTGPGLLCAYASGAMGNLMVYAFASKPHYNLGASGVVMGGLGLLAIQSFPLWRQAPSARKYILSAVIGGVMLFLLLGTAPGTDVLAHFGGFLGGLIFGGVVTLIPNLFKAPKINFLCGLLFALFVLWPWWIALHSAM